MSRMDMEITQPAVQELPVCSILYIVGKVHAVLLHDLAPDLFCRYTLVLHCNLEHAKRTSHIGQSQP